MCRAREHPLKRIATSVGVGHGPLDVRDCRRHLAQASAPARSSCWSCRRALPAAPLTSICQISPHRLEGFGQPAQGAQAEGGFVQQPGLVGFRERGRDTAPWVLEEAGDGSQVGTERAEFLRTVGFLPRVMRSR